MPRCIALLCGELVPIDDNSVTIRNILCHWPDLPGFSPLVQKEPSAQYPHPNWPFLALGQEEEHAKSQVQVQRGKGVFRALFTAPPQTRCVSLQMVFVHANRRMDGKNMTFPPTNVTLKKISGFNQGSGSACL